MTPVAETDGTLEAELATDWVAEFAARTTNWSSNAADAMRARPDWKTLTKAQRAKLYRERIRAAQKSRTRLLRSSKVANERMHRDQAAGFNLVPLEYWEPPTRPRRRKLWADY
jgi:hypothetical protein